MIEDDEPYLVLTGIDPRDAEREEVEAFCTELATVELRRCLNNEMGAELNEIAIETGAVLDLILAETSSRIRGGDDLVGMLRQGDDRDFAEWQFELVSRYLEYVSRRLDVPIEVVRP